MAIRCDNYNQICVVSIDGHFTSETGRHLRAAADDRIDQQKIVNFVIDCEKSDFVDSEGLEALLWLKRRSEDLFGKVKLANLDENYRKILEMTRLESRFEVHAGLPAALRTMRQSRKECTARRGYLSEQAKLRKESE